MSKLDRVYLNFLLELGVEQSDALMNFDFTFFFKGNIGILGMIHKRMLGRCHPVFQKLLPFKSELDDEHAVGPHDKQLSNHFNMLYIPDPYSAWWPFIIVYHRMWSIIRL